VSHVVERCGSLGVAKRAPLGDVIRLHGLELIRMSRYDRVLLRILRGTSDTNIPFAGLCQLLRRLGFEERIRGSHHIFTKDGVEEILNLQPKGRHAKPYQVRRVRHVVLKYRLGGQDDGR
jgi:HicA toxin of bacterial toxin-antitoxin,